MRQIFQTLQYFRLFENVLCPLWPQALCPRNSPSRWGNFDLVWVVKKKKKKKEKKEEKERKRKKKEDFLNRIKQYFIYLLIRFCWRHISEKPLWVGKNLRGLRSSYACPQYLICLRSQVFRTFFPETLSASSTVATVVNHTNSSHIRIC